MTIRINNLSLGLDDDIKLLKKKASKKLRISVDEIKDFKIVRESIDARNKDNIKITYAIEIEHKDEEKLVNRVHDNDVRIDNSKYEPDVEPGNEVLNHRPVVVGLGPAGLFSALMLAQKGYKPLVIERGEDVDKRTETVDKFWKTGELNLESNVQFGEGGAGSFSDGKLTTRIKDKKCDYVLQVGRIDKNKNLLNVIRAVKGHQLELVVIGGKYAYGDDGYYEECVKESASCNNIHFLGWLASDSKELASAYKNAKVVIVPSFHETFGLTASEAAMAGCKVCLSNTLPILEFGVFDSDLTFNPNNVDEIRTVIEKAMLAHNDNNVQRKAMNIFSWEKIVNNHIEIYNKLNNEK